MEYKKVWIALTLNTNRVNDDVNVNFSYGKIDGPYYSQTWPDKEFDTEEEAIKWAYESSKYEEWVIVQKLKFINY